MEAAAGAAATGIPAAFAERCDAIRGIDFAREESYTSVHAVALASPGSLLYSASLRLAGSGVSFLRSARVTVSC